MYDKYEIKSYQNYYEMKDSDSDSEKIESTLTSKKNTYINSKKYSDNIFQPEFIFSNETNNTSFYKSDPKSKYRKLNNHNVSQNILDPDFNYNIWKKKSSGPQLNYVEEKFSYNYKNENKDKENKEEELNQNINKEDCFNQEMYIDNKLNENDNQTPKRTIKSIQNQFNIEKNVNFKVLSYRPEDYEFEDKNIEGYPKYNQIFKKQDAGELFFPSKRALSPPSSSRFLTSKNQQQLHSYQKPTLKSQSFFGSFINSNNLKNINQNKSTLKMKKNNLEDFNIDKLIEIGDSYENNKMINIMSFGKKLKNIKNKLRNKKRIISKNKSKENKSIVKNVYKEKPKQENNIPNDINDKQFESKKLVYHGQIKRKRNIIKNSKTFNNIQNNEVNKNENKENPNNNMEHNNSNEGKGIIVNNNFTKNKRRTLNSNHKPAEIIDNKNNENIIYQEITPKKSNQKRKINLSLNNNNINNNNINNNINKNNYASNRVNNNYNSNDNKFNSNYNVLNSVSIPKGELNKNFLLTEDEMNYKKNNNIIEKSKPSLKKGLSNVGENYAKKWSKNINNNNSNSNNTNNNNVNQIPKKNYDKNIKAKRYYGYDDRNNLEGTINNHSYFESVYTKKKENPMIASFEKINYA